MTIQKQQLIDWFHRWVHCLPNGMLGMVLFFVVMQVAGRNLSGLAIAMMFVTVGLPAARISWKTCCGYYATLMGCACLGIVAGMNYVSCLVVNALAIFFITYAHGDEFLMRNHFLYGFVFLIAQTYHGLGWAYIPKCMLACVLCFCVMSLFIVWRRRGMQAQSGTSMVEKACGLLAQHLREFHVSEQEREFHTYLYGYCRNIYGDVAKQFGKMNQGQIWQYHVLLFLEQLNHLLAEDIAASHGGADTNREYHQHLAQVLETCLQQEEQQRWQYLRCELQKLVQTYHMDTRFADHQWRVTLSHLVKVLERAEERDSRQVSLCDGLYWKWRMMRMNFTTRSSVFRFAIKASVLTTLCFAVSYEMSFSRSVWLPMTVFCMLMVFHQDEQNSATARLMGTMMGTVVYLAFTEFLPGSYSVRMMVTMFLCFSLLFTFKDLTVTTLIATQMSVGSLADMGIGQALTARFMVVLVAALVVFMGGQLIFCTERRDAIVSHRNNIFYHYWLLVGQMEDLLEDRLRHDLSNELMLNINMYASELDALAQHATEEQRHVLAQEILPLCHIFRVELLHLFLMRTWKQTSRMGREYFEDEMEAMKQQLQQYLVV